MIWYGNIPTETRYVIARFFQDPWRTLAITAFVIGWLIPFSYLLGRLTGRPPESHRLLVGIAGLSGLAIFVERIVLVFPAALHEPAAPYGAGDALLTVLVTVGFGALFVLTFRVGPPRLGLAARPDS